MDKAKRDKIISIVKKVEFVAQNVALAVLLTVFVVQAFMPAFGLRVFGFRVLLISNTRSMEPTLEYNDLVLIRKYKIEKLKEGDIVSYLAIIEGEEIIITHRVLNVVVNEAGEVFLRTQGDNAPYPDLVPISKTGENQTFKYLGKYVGKSAFFGHLFSFFQSRYGATAMLINIAGLFFIVLAISSSKKPHKGEALSREGEWLHHNDRLKK